MDRVRAVEYGQHVGPADDPDQPPGLVDHGEPLDLAVVHEPRGVLHRLVGTDRHGRAGHQVGRRVSARLGPRGVVHDARQQSPDDVGLVRHGLLD
jgi:hypothetical protein